MRKGQVLKNKENFTLAIVASANPLYFTDTEGFEERIRDFSDVLTVTVPTNEGDMDVINFYLFRDTANDTYRVKVIDEHAILPAEFTVNLSMEKPSNKKLNKVIREAYAYHADREAFVKEGRESTIKVTVDPVEIKLDGNASAAEQYAQIMNTINSVSDEINSNTKATDSKALHDAMTEGWEVLEKYTDLGKATKVEANPGFFDRITGKAAKMEAEAKAANEAIEGEMITVKDHLDGLFGVLTTKKEKLLSVGDTAQRLLKTLEDQQDALIIVIAKTEKEKAEMLENVGYIPMSFQSQINDIIASDTIVKDKITRANALISLVNAGMHSLGHVLPGIKAALSDESAYAALVDEVEDVTTFATKMGSVLKDLSNQNADQLHNKIEGILDATIEDTTVMDIAEDRFNKATNLNSMISDKTGQLGDKLMQISTRTHEMAQLSTSSETTKQLQQFSN